MGFDSFDVRLFPTLHPLWDIDIMILHEIKQFVVPPLPVPWRWLGSVVFWHADLRYVDLRCQRFHLWHLAENSKPVVIRISCPIEQCVMMIHWGCRWTLDFNLGLLHAAHCRDRCWCTFRLFTVILLGREPSDRLGWLWHRHRHTHQPRLHLARRRSTGPSCQSNHIFHVHDVLVLVVHARFP